MPMPKTVAERLGLEPGRTLVIHNAPEDGLKVLGTLPDGVVVAPPDSGATADVVLLFVADTAQLRRDAHAVLDATDDVTKLWIAYPKGGATDLDRDSVLPAFIGLGWHNVALVELDSRWTAARFRRLEMVGR